MGLLESRAELQEGWNIDEFYSHDADCPDACPCRGQIASAPNEEIAALHSEVARLENDKRTLIGLLLTRVDVVVSDGKAAAALGTGLTVLTNNSYQLSPVISVNVEAAKRLAAGDPETYQLLETFLVDALKQKLASVVFPLVEDSDAP